MDRTVGVSILQGIDVSPRPYEDGATLEGQNAPKKLKNSGWRRLGVVYGTSSLPAGC